MVLSLDAVDPTALPLVGGKALHLGELVDAGFPVPAGFVVATDIYTAIAADAHLAPIVDALVARPDQLAELAVAARTAILETPIPAEVVHAIATAYLALGAGPVAVRSSATAEDLPFASFAGQQDTFLNVVGPDAVVDAVRRCWASLWSDRAVSHRNAVGTDHRAVRLAVVVQRMIDARLSGVLFTADPVHGTRRRAVIDASTGLGEPVVSGTVNPDRYVVDTASGTILERTCAGGRETLSDDRIRALVALGDQVEAHLGAPQDIDWAIDREGRIQLVQARPITTLFPVPSGPRQHADLRVYVSFDMAPGVLRPLTPMGIGAFQLLNTSMASFSGFPTGGMAEAAGRLFVDVTLMFRNATGRTLLTFGTVRSGRGRAASGVAILERLAQDPRLSLVPTSRWRVARTVLSLLARTRFPLHVLEALMSPNRARVRAVKVVEGLRDIGRVPPDTSPGERLAVAEDLLLAVGPRVVPAVAPVFGAGLLASSLAGKLLGDLATDDERRVAMRALPHDPTTEMDIALWELSREVDADAESARAVRDASPDVLAATWREGTLPGALQRGLARFLRVYGHCAVAEIDLGLPRWSEDPGWVFGVLAGQLRIDDPERAPDARFRRAEREALDEVDALVQRASGRSRVRGALVRFLLGRARDLSGLREMPKLAIALVFARVRELVLPVGEELVAEGRLSDRSDIFFLSLPEAYEALSGHDLRLRVRERRDAYLREMGRRRVPRVVLSDGTEVES